MKPELKIKFYGTRGSIPISDLDFQEFGGNTTCISMMGNVDKRIAILDAGTGIRKLGKEISSPGNKLNCNDITIFFSHFHWDHILGFPFFSPAYEPKRRITIMAMGKNWPINNLREVFDVAMHSEYFPVKLDDMRAQIDRAPAHSNDGIAAVFAVYPGKLVNHLQVRIPWHVVFNRTDVDSRCDGRVDDIHQPGTGNPFIRDDHGTLGPQTVQQLGYLFQRTVAGDGFNGAEEFVIARELHDQLL